MTEIRKFIDDNKLDFKTGSRNTTVVALIGYCQYLEKDQAYLENQLEEEINTDSFIKEEIDRLWDYCKTKNYRLWWLDPKAHNSYTF